MEGIVVAILSMLLVFALVPLFPWKRRQVSKSDEHNEEPQVEQDDNISGNHNFHPHDDDANVHHHELCHGKDEVSNDADNVQDTLRGGIIIHEFDDLHISNHKECVQDVVRKLYDATKYMLADKISVDDTGLVHDDDGGEEYFNCSGVAEENDDEKCDVITVNSTRSHEDPKKDVQQSVATDQAIVEHEKDDKLEKRCVGHYNNQQKILLVGEGDFSFSSCLATAFLSASNLTATSLDSRETVMSNYSKGEKNLRNLEERGAVVIHQVDAGTMNNHPRLRSKLFDRIVFNFPHAGGTYSAVKESDSWYIKLHQRVVRRFFKAARKMLTERGQVHVTHKTGYPFHTWEIIQLAKNVGLVLIRSKPWRNAYAGYDNKKAYGSSWDSTFPVRGAYTYVFCTRKS